MSTISERVMQLDIAIAHIGSRLVALERWEQAHGSPLHPDDTYTDLYLKMLDLESERDELLAHA